MSNLLFFRLLSVLCICLILLFVGCSDDDDDDNNNNNNDVTTIITMLPLLGNRAAQTSLRVKSWKPSPSR